MALRRKFALLIISALFASQAAFGASDSFVIKRIQVEGAEGMNANTVASYLPVKVGQTLHPSDTANVIAALYQTGFFSDVSLSREGNTLVVHVAERPVIAAVNISGNSLIDTDQINTVLKNIGLVKGQTLDRSLLDQVTKSLQSAYDMQGHYNAIVTTTVSPLSRHRVNVAIHISEGRVALVQHIEILGNHAFSQSKLLDTLKLTPPKWNSFYTRADHYSKDAFHDSLESLSNYYFDRGYLHFTINSANAVLSPDRKSVTLVIQVTEGAQYKLSGFSYSGGLSAVSPQELDKLPAVKALKPGSIFSRQQIVDASKAIQYAFGDKGYAFANVNIIPAIDEKNKTAHVTFQIDPGKRVYIHHINYQGNTSTADEVLRYSTQVLEGGTYSSTKLDQSTQSMNMLGFFTGVKEDTVPVEGSNNQADLNYSVTEQPSAQATVGAGYGTADGLILNAGINEMNFMGTGRQVGVNFARSVFQQSYSFNYNNPYYTPSGVQRGFNLYSTKTDMTSSYSNTSPYDFNEYGGTMIYSIPFSFSDSYQVGIGAQRVTLSPGTGASQQMNAFVNNEGSVFNQGLITLGWTRNKLNFPIFPTEGTYQTLSAQISTPLVGEDLNYYKLNYNFKGYFPLPYDFIGNVIANAGYGNGYGSTRGLPFFANYYAGGLGVQGQVRGYDTNSLGPKDSLGFAYGGNMLLSGTAQLILPKPLRSDSFRVATFVDAGQVYDTWNVYNTLNSTVTGKQTGVSLSDLRYAAGVDFEVRIPVMNAVLEFALAKALNAKVGDKSQFFSFNIGTSF